jgi:hypothetical protein
MVKGQGQKKSGRWRADSSIIPGDLLRADISHISTSKL